MTAQAKDFPAIFEELATGTLSAEATRVAFAAVLGGKWSSAEVAGFLCGLRVHGENESVIREAACAMRDAMVPVTHSFGDLLDTCGTGGDGTGTVNLSTGSAILCAACGVRVAKHGNRAASSKAGSADVLEKLGISTDLPANSVEPVLREAGIAFMMAPLHHPAVRHVVPVRKALKIRTLFNCLGPLANPAGANLQLLGAYADNLRPILAATLRDLGTRRAWVVRGEDGMDEISPYAKTRVTELEAGKLREFVVSPEDFGVSTSAPGAAQGGTAEQNAEIIHAVLSGKSHSATDAFIINAAAGLVVALGMPMKDAAMKVREVLKSGAAMATLERWRKVTHAHG